MDNQRLSTPAILILVAPILLIGFFSTSPAYEYNKPDDSMLIVSFKKSTVRVKLCSEEELKEFKAIAKTRRPHMQRASRVCGSRERVPLALAIWLDGEKVTDKHIFPSGLRNDGLAFVYDRFKLTKGNHKVRINISDHRKKESGEAVSFSENIKFDGREIVVVEYDKGTNKLFVH